MKKTFFIFIAFIMLFALVLAESVPPFLENEYYIESLNVIRTFSIGGGNSTTVNLTLENTGEELANLEVKERLPSNLGIQMTQIGKLDPNQSFVAVMGDEGSIEIKWKLSKISKGETISLPYSISKALSKSELEEAYAMPSIIREVKPQVLPQNGGESAKIDASDIKVQVRNQAIPQPQAEEDASGLLYFIVGIAGIIIAAAILSARQSKIEQ